jgi:hypothetical protein
MRSSLSIESTTAGGDVQWIGSGTMDLSYFFPITYLSIQNTLAIHCRSIVSSGARAQNC